MGKDTYEEYLEAGVMPGNLEKGVNMWRPKNWQEIKQRYYKSSMPILDNSDFDAGADAMLGALKMYIHFNKGG